MTKSVYSTDKGLKALASKVIGILENSTALEI